MAQRLYVRLVRPQMAREALEIGTNEAKNTTSVCKCRELVMC